jgi:hypothetical protein
MVEIMATFIMLFLTAAVFYFLGLNEYRSKVEFLEKVCEQYEKRIESRESIISELQSEIVVLKNKN